MGSDEFPARHSFDNLVLTVDILFAIRAIAPDRNGRLERCASSS